MDYVPWPGFGPFESYEADHTVAGGETLELAGLHVRGRFTPGHSPGHVSYALADEGALFSGDVLFQGSVGRVDLPGGDWPTLLASIESLVDAYPPETTVYPGHMGITTLGAERATNPFLRELAQQLSELLVIQAPQRHVRRAPGRRGSGARCSRRTPTRILGAAGYRRIETPTFEATELFARGVGEATDIVQKEMYTFDDGGGRSLTLRPEGTAPVCRAYIEHGMHKLPQPVKLWYLSSFFRAEAPQRGRYRQFWQVGAEAIGSAAPETDAELIVLLAELLQALGVSGTRLRLSSLGTPETRAEYREELTRIPARARGRAVRRGARPDRPEPDARVRRRATRRTQRDDARRADAARPARPRRRRALRAVRELLDDAGIALRARPDARARPGLLHADGVRVHHRRARRAVGRRRRRPLRRPDRAARRARRRPASGWAAGVERMLLAAGELPIAPELVDLFVALATADDGAAGPRSSSPARRAAPGCRRSSSSPAARSRASSSTPTGSARATSRSSATTSTASLKNMESGDAAGAPSAAT